MPGPLSRLGDKNSAGGVVVTGNPTVLVNGRPITRLGDKVTPHPCCGARGCPPTHCAARTTSSNYTVLVGGIPVTTVGDSDTCGHPRASGSFNVFVGR
jgi:uncharacterized Zn-binding protein involved in type VI secretion